MTFRRLSKLGHILISGLFVLSMSLQGIQPAAAQDNGKVRIQHHPQTGKVSFIGAEPGHPISVRAAQAPGMAASDRAMSMVEAYAADFGLKQANRELKVSKNETARGRQITKFQQVYQGIPVMAGELVVNADNQGGLLSINGEISPDLNLDTRPAISAAEAERAALQSVAKWYKGKASDFRATQPALWIYDSRLLQPDGMPPSLVWRLDVTAKDAAVPVRELVLVDAQRGNIALHFNQVPDAGSLDPASPVASAMTGTTRFVSTTGADTGACTDSGSPCRTMNYTIGQAASGDTIKAASGTYTGSSSHVVDITKSLSILGGWDAAFITNVGQSIIDGQTSRTGMWIEGSNLTVNISQVAVQHGYSWGIYENNPGGILTVDRSAIVNNSGNGIYNVAGNVSITNATISGNHSLAYNGSAIITYNGTTTIQFSTITNNSGSMAAIYVAAEVITVQMGNSILAGNSGYDCVGSIVSTGNNIFGQSSPCYWPIWTQPSDQIGVNPQLAPLTPSSLHPLIFNSPAINAAAGPCPATDQRGLARPQGSACDIGAYEYGGTGTTPASIWLYQGAEQTILPGMPAAINLAALVTDADGTPVPAVGVTFTAPASGASGTFSSGTRTIAVSTDAKGIANAGTFTANASQGTYTVGATVGGLAPAVFTLTNAAADIRTYTMNNSANYSLLPGTLRCNLFDYKCTNGLDPDADAAEAYALGTYLFYMHHFDRNSLDNAGMPIILSVHYGNNWNNAEWYLGQVIFGEGWSQADDVVAHELTHGVTEHESNLFYYYQSGAINESMSDVFGELYDQSNGLGNDTAGVRWLIGEDVPGYTTGFRSMSDPPSKGDPDKMTSGNYDFDLDETDNGGVHHNSGINNKAASLLVDGGSFNSKTVTALGADKTLAIYYEVNTHLLTSGSDYGDLYTDLYQACLLQVGGPQGITLGDCQSVQDAVDAVEMNVQLTPSYNTEAPVCSSGSEPLNAFFDGFENGTGNWTISNGQYPRWQIDTGMYGPYARSGKHSLWADDFTDPLFGQPADTSVAMKNGVTLPPNAYLHFAHAYDFEHYVSNPDWYDGGVLEYSANNGPWTDAGLLVDANGYNGTVSADYNNPLAGRQAFVGASHGYISTRLNLSALASQSVRFRWRMGLDDYGYSWGWWLDDVQIYTCRAPITISGNVGMPGVSLTYTGGFAVSSTGGAYSINVPLGWSGTISASKDGYTFEPASLSYSNLTSSLANQNFTAHANTVKVYIGGSKAGDYYVPSGGRVTPQYNLLNGPVQVVSTDAASMFTSQRVHNATGFVNELMGLSLSQMTNEYWFPWYDNLTMQTWLLVGNPSGTLTAHVHVYIAGEDMNPAGYDIGPGGRVTPTFARLNGPVHIVSDNDVFTSERVHTGQGFVQETAGYPANQLAQEYWFPWYDNLTMTSWILVGNPSDTLPAHVHIYIGGEDMNPDGYDLGPGGRVTPTFARLNGPVHVVSDIPVFTSERVHNGTGFINEVMGVANNRLTNEYWFPWYDNLSMTSWILVGNPDTAKTAQVDIYIAGNKVGHYEIPPGGRETPQYPILNGPVHVVSDINVFTSERVHTGQGFVNEVMGYPKGDLSAEYWFPWYDNLTMTSWVLVGRP